MAVVKREYLFAILCGLFLSCNSIISAGDHQVKYHGKSKVFEGDFFRISCFTPILDPPRWTLNSSLVISEENEFGFILSERQTDIFYREMILESRVAQLFHEGEYRCNKYSRDYHFIRVQPYFQEDHKNINEGAEDTVIGNFDEYTLKRDQTLEFHCALPNDAVTPVTWYKERQIIAPNVDSRIEISGRTLIIHKARDDDAGEYTCMLGVPPFTELPELGFVFRLNSPAKIIDFPKSLNIIRSRSMILQCKAQGFPLPTIAWFIGNLDAQVVRKEDTRISTFSEMGQRGVANLYLVIRNLSITDRGFYTCRAENSINARNEKGYEEKSVFVYIRENMIETNEDEPGMGKILIPGKQLVLHCNTTECPQCILVWYKDGEPLYPIPEKLEIHEGNNSVVIKHSTYNDSGIYTCAINRTQLDMDLSATINVQPCSFFYDQGYISSTLNDFCEQHAHDMASLQTYCLQNLPLLHIVISFIWARVMI